MINVRWVNPLEGRNPVFTAVENPETGEEVEHNNQIDHYNSELYSGFPKERNV